ncbi:MAG: hypothetical protein AAF206_00620 [Bacteroidota bacterium]
MRRLIPAILASIFILSGCTRDNIPARQLSIPDLIQPYIDDFEREAMSRGIDIDIDNLIVEFEGNLNNGSAAGLCTYAGENVTPVIHLDTTSTNWQNNEFSREILVFHELGHCILTRISPNSGHTDVKLPNGNLASIMRSTGEQVYGGNMNAFKRAYYLDELFNPETPAPDWARNPPAYGSLPSNSKTSVLSDDFSVDNGRWPTNSGANSVSRIENGKLFFESKSENTAFFLPRNVVLNSAGDFEIEASIRIVSGDRSAMIQWGGTGPDDFFFYGINADAESAFLGNWTKGIDVTRSGEPLSPTGFNKLTIRKLDGFYHIYLNEVYIDVLEFQEFFGPIFAFYVGPQTAIEIDFIQISEIE